MTTLLKKALNAHLPLILTACAFGVRSATLLIRTKLIALLLGPQVYGLIALYTNIIDIYSSLGSLGLGPALAKKIPTIEKNYKTVAFYFNSAYAVTILSSIIISILLIPLTLFTVSRFLDFDVSYIHVLLISMACTLFSLSSIQQSLLFGMKKYVISYTIITVSNIFGSILSIIAIIYLNTFGAILALPIIPSIIFLCFRFFIANNIDLNRKFPTFRKIFRHISILNRTAYVVLSTKLIALFSLFISQMLIAYFFSMEWLGYFSAVYFFALFMNNVIYDYCENILLPRLSRNFSEGFDISRDLNRDISVIFLVFGTTLLLLSIFLCQVISIIFSEQFLEATDLFALSLTGSLFIIVAQPAHVLLMAQKNPIHFAVAETIWNGFWLTFIVLGCLTGNPAYLGIGFLTASILYFFYLYGMAYIHGGFLASLSNWLLVVLYIGAFGLVGLWRLN